MTTPHADIIPATLWSIICPRDSDQQSAALAYHDDLVVKVVLHVEANGKSYREINTNPGGFLFAKTYQPPGVQFPKNSVVEVWGTVNAFKTKSYQQLQHKIIYTEDTNANTLTTPLNTLSELLYQHFAAAQEYFFQNQHHLSPPGPSPPIPPTPPNPPQRQIYPLPPPPPFAHAKWCEQCEVYITEIFSSQQQQNQQDQQQTHQYCPFSGEAFLPTAQDKYCPGWHWVCCRGCGQTGYRGGEGRYDTKTWVNGYCSECCNNNNNNFANSQHKDHCAWDGHAAPDHEPFDIPSLCTSCLMTKLKFCPCCGASAVDPTSSAYLATHQGPLDEEYATALNVYNYAIKQQQKEYEKQQQIYNKYCWSISHYPLLLQHCSSSLPLITLPNSPPPCKMACLLGVITHIGLASTAMRLGSFVIGVVKSDYFVNFENTDKNNNNTHNTPPLLTNQSFISQTITLPPKSPHGNIPHLPVLGSICLLFVLQHDVVFVENANVQQQQQNKKKNSNNPQQQQQQQQNNCFTYINHLQLVAPQVIITPDAKNNTLLNKSTKTSSPSPTTPFTPAAFDHPAFPPHLHKALSNLFHHHHAQVLKGAICVHLQGYLEYVPSSLSPIELQREQVQHTLNEQFIAHSIDYPKQLILHHIQLLTMHQQQQQREEEMLLMQSPFFLQPAVVEDIKMSLDYYEKHLYVMINTNPYVVLSANSPHDAQEVQNKCEYQQLFFEYQEYCTETLSMLSSLVVALPDVLHIQDQHHLSSGSNVAHNNIDNNENNNENNNKSKNNNPHHTIINPTHQINPSIPMNLLSLTDQLYISDTRSKYNRHFVDTLCRQQLQRQKLYLSTTHNILQHTLLLSNDKYNTSQIGCNLVQSFGGHTCTIPHDHDENNDDDNNENKKNKNVDHNNNNNNNNITSLPFSHTNTTINTYINSTLSQINHIIHREPHGDDIHDNEYYDHIKALQQDKVLFFFEKLCAAVENPALSSQYPSSQSPSLLMSSLGDVSALLQTKEEQCQTRLLAAQQQYQQQLDTLQSDHHNDLCNQLAAKDNEWCLIQQQQQRDHQQQLSSQDQHHKQQLQQQLEVKEKYYQNKLDIQAKHHKQQLTQQLAKCEEEYTRKFDTQQQQYNNDMNKTNNNNKEQLIVLQKQLDTLQLQYNQQLDVVHRMESDHQQQQERAEERYKEELDKLKTHQQLSTIPNIRTQQIQQQQHLPTTDGDNHNQHYGHTVSMHIPFRSVLEQQQQQQQQQQPRGQSSSHHTTISSTPWEQLCYQQLHVKDHQLEVKDNHYIQQLQVKDKQLEVKDKQLEVKDKQLEAYQQQLAAKEQQLQLLLNKLLEK